MSPEQPMASSSACGARTTADLGRLDSNTRVERDGRRFARVVAQAVVEGRFVDQLVERDPRSPADASGRVQDGQLLDGFGLRVQRSVDHARVGVLDRAGTVETLDDALSQVPDGSRVARVAEVEDRMLRVECRINVIDDEAGEVGGA